MKKNKVDFEQDDHVQATSFAWNKLLEKGMQQTKKPIYYLWIWQKRTTVYQYQNFGKFWENQI